MHKAYPVIGCCGIDCGLCPRYHTGGASKCPGCGGDDFHLKHPSCGFLTCCITRHNAEVCGLCNEFPCNRFEPEKEGYDSFVTHRRIFQNLSCIKKEGIEAFISRQRQRMDFLNMLLGSFDDGRSKSYFCLASALLPLTSLEAISGAIKDHLDRDDIRAGNRLVKELIDAAAHQHEVTLKLNNKKK